MPVTANVYERVVRLTTADGGFGAAFTIDVGDVQFLITARHVLPADAPVEVRLTNRFVDETRVVEPLAGMNVDADIAVIRLDEQLTKTADLPVVPSFDRAVYSQDMYFLGFPYGLALRVGGHEIVPFVKRAILSASDDTPGGAKVLLLDGFNNPGFSGGPVAFWDDGNHAHICGVVSGYRYDLERVLDGDKRELEMFVQANTGIVVAYDIRHAMDVIDTNVRESTD